MKKIKVAQQPGTRDDETIWAALKAFREALPEIHVEVKEDSHRNVLITQYNDKKYTFEILVRKNLNPATAFDSLVKITNSTNNGNSNLLISQYVSRNTAYLLKRNNIFFLDTVGNAHLKAGDLFVFITDNRKKKTSSQKVKRAFYGSGLKVIFSLLNYPELVNLPYRSLAKIAGVSLGTIGGLFHDLYEMGYLVYLDKNRKRLINRKALFEKWIEAFSEKFRPNILRGTFRFVKPEPFRPDVLKQTLKPFPGTFFGGESAAQLITGYLKAGTLTLYTTGDTIDIVKTLKILPDDTGPVTILDVFWNPDYYAQHLLTPDFPGIVPFPLVYADLVISGDERNLEGAKVLYEKYLQNIIQ